MVTLQVNTRYDPGVATTGGIRMKNSRSGQTKMAGIAGVVVAALGLLLGLAFVAPAGAQDGGDSYTTASPSGDSTGGTTGPSDAAADSAADTGGTAGPSDAAADSAADTGGTAGTPSSSGGTSGTSGGAPGGSTGGSGGVGSPGGGTSGGASGIPGASSGPLARTGFGATLPSLLATALVAGGAMLVIAVARRRRSSTS